MKCLSPDKALALTLIADTNDRFSEFALNPVSINHVDQVEIRVRLANEQQVIVRADRVDRAPAGP